MTSISATLERLEKPKFKIYFKGSHHEFQKIAILQLMFSNNDAIKTQTNNKLKSRKISHIWELKQKLRESKYINKFCIKKSQ